MKTSIALCTYNGEKYISEQLDSILSQTVCPNEIVISDDGSTDSTLEIISEYQKKYSIIRLFKNEENLGFIKNFEKVILLCQYDIIIISDQDDVWEKNKIEQTLYFFKDNPQFDGVFHDLKLINMKSPELSYLNWKNISHDIILKDISEKKIFYSLITKGSFVLGCALAIRKEAIDKYQIKDFPFAHDFYIAQKLSVYNKLGFIPKTLSSYRLHENQVYGLRYKSKNKRTETVSESKKYFTDFVWPYLNVIKKYQEIRPGNNVRQTEIFKSFIIHRNKYLKSLSFLERKKYITKCIRYQYLYLQWQDLFKI